MGGNSLKVAIAILNYNGIRFLEEYLPDIITYSPSYASIHVIDNASSDQSLQFLETQFPQINTIALDKNYGFSEGYNLGLNEISATYYVLLNSDIKITEDWLSPIIEFMDKDPEVGACQPKILSIKEPNKFEHAGAAGGWLDILGYPFCRGRILGTVEHDLGQYDSIEEVFWATGAAMVVRSKIWHNLKGFDPDFFAHMEEIDLCYRMKRSGHSIVAIPSAKVYHLGGGTLPYDSNRKIFLNFRNSLFLLLKNKRHRSLFFIIPIRLVLDGIAALFFLLQGKPAYCKEVFRAHIDFYKHFKIMYAKRKDLAHLKYKNMNKNGIYRGSIVMQYYLFGQKHFFTLLSSWKTKI